MQSEWDCGLGDQEAKVAQMASKEGEWKELQDIRIYELESSLKNAKEECLILRYHIYIYLTQECELKNLLCSLPGVC